MLNRQLGAVALVNPSELGKTETDVIFNDGTFGGVQCKTRSSANGTVSLGEQWRCDQPSIVSALGLWRETRLTLSPVLEHLRSKATLRGTNIKLSAVPCMFISTRTGKRDLGGLLNDGVNSLAR